MKSHRKDAGGRKTEQHPNHPQPKLSSVQSAVGCALQESDFQQLLTRMQELAINPPKKKILVCEESAIIDGH